jgi:hypothetical protein
VPRVFRWTAGRLSADAAAAAARVALVLLLVPTNLYLYAWRFVEIRRQAPPYFLRQDEKAALDWLARNATPADVALAPEMIGQFVPNYGATRAYLAHWAMTNRYHERVDRVRTFFSPETSDEWRISLMKAEGVTLVLKAGDVPGLPQLYDVGASTRWEPVFSRPDATIFRLRPEPDGTGRARPPAAEGAPGR